MIPLIFLIPSTAFLWIHAQAAVNLSEAQWEGKHSVCLCKSSLASWFCFSVMELLIFYRPSVYHHTLSHTPSILVASWTCSYNSVGFRNHRKVWAFIIKGSPKWFLFYYLLARINTVYHYNLCKTTDVYAWQAKPSERLRSSPAVEKSYFYF